MSDNDPRRKLTLLFSVTFTLAMVVLIAIAQPAYADSMQVSASVSLQDFSIQVEYPSVVLPGTNTQVNVQAIAKSAVTLDSLTTDIYYVDGTNLQQVTSATIVGAQNVASGNTFASDIPISVPQGMPRTSLFATFTEAVKFSYVSSSSYSYYYNGYDYGCSSYPAYSYDNMQYCSYYNSYGSYPQNSYVTMTDTGISPLSYVNATTPEYTSLLSQYQTQQQQLSQAQTQNQNLQQQISQQNRQISQLQAQIQQLQSNLQSAQGTISQASSNNSNLNSQLNNANTMNHNVTYLLIAFGMIAILALVLGQHSKQPRKTQSVNPYAANYVPSQNEHPQHAQ